MSPAEATLAATDGVVPMSPGPLLLLLGADRVLCLENHGSNPRPFVSRLLFFGFGIRRLSVGRKNGRMLTRTKCVGRIHPNQRHSGTDKVRPEGIKLRATFTLSHKNLVAQCRCGHW
jgi:hypothetical protein